MTAPFSFHPAARRELIETVRFYQSERPGVGAEFAKEVRDSIDQIVTHPLSGSPGPGQTRNKILPHFPYTVVYLFEGAEIKIIAVAHQRRKPGYWRDRLGERGG